MQCKPNVCYGPKAACICDLSGDESPCSWQNNPDLREFARLRVDFDPAAMLFNDNVVTDGKAEPGAFSGGLRCEKRIKHFFLHLRRNAHAIVTDPDFHAIAKAFRGGHEGRFVNFALRKIFIPRCVDAIGNQIEQSPRDFLRENISLSGSRVERLFDRDIETVLLGSRSVIGKFEALLDNCIDRYRPVFTRTLVGMQQHVLDDRISTLAVLNDLVEVAAQRTH